MAKVLAIVVFVGLLAIVSAGKFRTASSYWTNEGPCDANALLTFTVALPQKNIKELEQFVLDVSNPHSPNYGNYKSKEEITEMVAPSLEHSQSVADYFTTACPSAKVKNLRDALQVTASIACVESIFQIKMASYHHTTKATRILRRDRNGPAVTFPEEIKDKIDFITGISNFPIPRSTKSEVISDPKIISKIAKAEVDSYKYIIPQTVRRLYNIPVGSKVTNKKNSQSVIEFSGFGAPNLTDLVTFAQEADEVFTNITTFVGAFDQDAEGESTLDYEYETSLAPGADQYYVTIDGWIYEMALGLFNLPNTPLVNSVSYGWPESLSCESGITDANCDGYTSQTYNARADAELAKLAGNGISVIVCSQDEGAPSEQNIDCSLDSTQPLWPIYPGCSPWVTSVSATVLVDTSTQKKRDPPICQGYPCDDTGTLEYPCMVSNTLFSWTTGGGFSNYTARPSYQNSAVQSYLASNALIPPSWTFKNTHRGYPDVSALGSRILIWDGGAATVTAGTSASTPIFAAMVTLLNDWRLNNGKSPLGFLNGILYDMVVATPSTFKDITVGNNTCTEGVCCTYGYGCWAGWDPVTGLGTPNYPSILKYVQTLK